MEDFKIRVIGDSIFFGAYEVAKIKKEITSTLRGDFEEKIKGLDVKNEELEELEKIIYQLQARSSDISDTANDLQDFFNKIRG